MNKNVKEKNIFNFILIVILFIFNFGVIFLLFKEKYNSFSGRGIVLVIFSFVLEFLLIFLLKKFKKIKIENRFLLLFLIIGFLYLFVFPMNQTPDEGAHVFRAYEISLGYFSSTVKDNRFVGRELPKSVSSVLDNSTYQKTYNNLKTVSNNDKEFVVFDNTALYSFICYVPQALGIAISRVFTNHILIQLYVGRMFNFLTFTLLFYLAIKFLPFKKEFLFFVAFLPMTIQEAISLAPDCLTIASSVFLLSYVMYLRENRNTLITKKQILLLTIICIMISQCKIVYLPVCLLLFLLPKEKFTTKKKKYIIIFSMACLVICLNLVWLKIASQFLAVSSSGKSSNQILYILENPFRYFLVCGNTFYLSFQVWIFQLLGKNLGWFNIVIPDIYLLVSLFILIILIISYDKSDFSFTKSDKLILGLICLCTVMLIFTSLYVQWTDYQSNTIAGIQGRYFLPIVALMPFICSNINFKVQKKNLSKYFYVFLVFENCLVISMVILYYM